MGAVTIEEGDEERSIVTPDLRLRFRWLGDRWTHAIDLGPPPWETAARVHEWTEAESSIRPTYQELHFQADGDNVLAMAIGRAGPHHFSATFRMEYRGYRTPHFTMPSILQDRSQSRLIVDIADRCRAERVAPEVRYHVIRGPHGNFLPGSDEELFSVGTNIQWHGCLMWEAHRKNNYHVYLGEASRKERPTGTVTTTRCAIEELDYRPLFLARVAGQIDADSDTQRLVYLWEHARVHVVKTSVDVPTEPPWSLPGAIRTDDL